MREIIGYEGLYEWDGENVRSVQRKGTSGKVLKWNHSHNGRACVMLCKDGKYTTFCKYQLIWMDAHQQAIPQAFEIHHIDGDFTNNDPSNLQLLTREEHKRIHGMRDVNCFKDGKLIAVFPSANEAARQLELHDGSICQCCNGKRKTCGGYQFSWASEPKSETDGQLLFNFVA